jgi:GGDEF domain-containing protein
VIVLDLDHFKQVNDSLGHAGRDEVLRAFGRVLRGTDDERQIVRTRKALVFIVRFLAATRQRCSTSGDRSSWMGWSDLRRVGR